LRYIRHGWWETDVSLGFQEEGVEYKYLMKCDWMPEPVWESRSNRSFGLLGSESTGVLVDIWGTSETDPHNGASKTSARIMTYNIRYDTPADGRNSWAFRKDLVKHLILSHMPHVLGIQEALFHQVMDLYNALKDKYSWVGCGRDDGMNAGEFNPIFYDH